MIDDIDVDTFDLQRFAEALVEDAREGVKWERRKLEWILLEREKDAGRSEAA
jgi:hypothetical protein